MGERKNRAPVHATQHTPHSTAHATQHLAHLAAFFLSIEVADDTRNALGNMRTEMNRTIRTQSEEVIDAASRTSQAMNL